MSRYRATRRTGLAGPTAVEVVRFCLALYLVLQIVGAPIHLYLEPHSDVADPRPSGALAWAAAVMEDGGHDGDGHHDRHSAAEHQLKALRTQRAPVAEMVTIPVVEAVAAEKGCPQSQVFEFSGLSPPELSRCWQFIFRAALPVRAPSLLS